MCDEYPILDERYGIRTNRGYGAAKHIEGIKKWDMNGIDIRLEFVRNIKIEYNLF